MADTIAPTLPPVQPALIGRERELALLRERLAAALAGRGWVCDCQGFTFTGMCKHLGQVERRSEREGWSFGRIAPRLVA